MRMRSLPPDPDSCESRGQAGSVKVAVGHCEAIAKRH